MPGGYKERLDEKIIAILDIRRIITAQLRILHERLIRYALFNLGENQTAEYIRINPFKLVPVIEDDGFSK